MDPFIFFWIVGGLTTFIGGSVWAARADDIGLFGLFVVLGLVFPFALTLAIMTGIIAAPFFIARFFISRKEKELNRFKSIDAELDKQIEETRKMVE
jgi:hypothetical protein